MTGVMNRGGAEVMLMNIYRNLPANVQFDFLINYKVKQRSICGDFDEEIIARGGRLRYIGTHWDIGIIKYIIQFKKIIHDIGKPDAVHIHLNAKCGVISLAARLSGIKKIVAHSHEVPEFKGRFAYVLLRWLEFRFQKILIALFATDYWGCSQGAIDSHYYKWARTQWNTALIKNAINISDYQNVSDNLKKDILNKYKCKEGAVIIGNVGRIIREKNVDYILDVLHVLSIRGIEFIFAFAGRVDDADYMHEIVDKAEKYNLKERVVHLGDRSDIPAILSTFDVFVAPNQNEGFGMVAVEAQASGLPCILSKGFPQAVDMGLGLVTFMDSYDPEKWAAAISALKGRKCTDRNAIFSKIAERGFNAAESTKSMLELYRA